MRIAYRNDLEDILALQRQVLRHTPMGRTLLLHRFIAVEVILAVICLLLAWGNPNPWILVFFVGISALAWLFRERSVLMMFKKEMKRQLARSPEAAFRDETVMELTRDGVAVSQGGATVLHPWAEMVYVGEDTRRIYVLTGGLRNYAVPKAVLGEGRAARLSGELRSRIGAVDGPDG